MKVLTVHNRYQQRGGEDVVVEMESRILREHGHEVISLCRDNAEIPASGLVSKLRYARDAFWSRDTYNCVRDLIRKTKPTIAHVHNTVFVVSPSVYSACKGEGIPVVQTLHNFRLLCPPSTFLRDGQVCRDCVSSSLLEGVRHGCYRGSRCQTAFLASILAVHRRAGTLSSAIDTYIALSEFSRGVFIESGFDPERVVVKNNSVADPGPPLRTRQPYAVFVGRLVPEKGVRTLLRAWQLLPEIHLKIVGSGSLETELKSYAAAMHMSNVSFLGDCDHARAVDTIRNARMMVFPSEWYEGHPLSILEAFASGVPVVGSHLGVMLDLIEPDVTGWFFEAGNADHLAAVTRRVWNDEALLWRCGVNARKAYTAKYHPAASYERLMEIYENTIACKRTRVAIAA